MSGDDRWNTAAEVMTAALAVGDPTHDPFAAFSATTGSDVADPYPAWNQLRAACPVQNGLALPEGDTSLVSFLFADRERRTALSFEAVSAVLRNERAFSSASYSMTFDLVWGRTIIGMDEPDHSDYRRLISTAFNRKEMDHWERDIVRPVLGRYVDGLVGKTSLDLVQDLLLVFPVTVIAEAIGLPKDDLPRFFRLAVEMSNLVGEAERAFAASQALGEYLQGQLEQRRATGTTGDLLGHLIDARLPAADGGQEIGLTDVEIVSFIRLLLIAGAETTSRSSASMLRLLLENTAQWEALREDRSLVPAAVEESLRLEAPLASGIFRFATEDAIVDGVAVPAGCAVQSGLGAANRDPARWDRPDDFDVQREVRAHLAFGSGVHTCMGMHVARTEMRVVLEEVLDRFVGLRLDPQYIEAGQIRGRELRSPSTLPVVVDRILPS